MTRHTQVSIGAVVLSVKRGLRPCRSLLPLHYITLHYIIFLRRKHIVVGVFTRSILVHIRRRHHVTHLQRLSTFTVFRSAVVLRTTHPP